jgi:hypothetical protein
MDEISCCEDGANEDCANAGDDILDMDADGE